MSTDAELFSIGQLAARTGLTSRTIRFWSDAGLVPPAGRSAGGYRLYDGEAVARLDLVWTLRELGLGLEVIRAVLSQSASGLDYRAVLEHAGQALADGIAPGSPEGQSVLDRLVPAAERPVVLAQLETFTDARVERYWQLLGVLRGQPPFPPAVPAFEWLIAALRARP
jgi:DNA-binding transcriptional MerR regulator